MIPVRIWMNDHRRLSLLLAILGVSLILFWLIDEVMKPLAPSLLLRLGRT